ncbi:ATP-binding protein [Nonomuraea phyllanthi]|uniref:ATP-binding protein n=1 Tax=Nonomuraea phyllanthi TaxID=2219224 RepID=A0A5C4WRA2_9ACTN|nr:ATP-binding protein [Nonomuraea phyllanthi]
MTADICCLPCLAQVFRLTVLCRPKGRRTAPVARDRRASWGLPQDVASIPAGRHLVSRKLAEWGLRSHSDLADVMELLASELLTNAVEHAWGDVVLTLSARGETLRCAVWDEDAQLPCSRHAGPSDEGGRGLLMVHLMSRRWGVDVCHAGKAVWFEAG